MNTPGQPPVLAVLGMGCAGLSLAQALSRRFQTIGFDMRKNRLEDLRQSPALARSGNTLPLASKLALSSSLDQLADADVYIITPGTLQHEAQDAGFATLHHASGIVGLVLEAGNMVLFASCASPRMVRRSYIQSMESISELRCHQDFYVGHGTGADLPTLCAGLRLLPGTPPAARDWLQRFVRQAGCGPQPDAGCNRHPRAGSMASVSTAAVSTPVASTAAPGSALRNQSTFILADHS